MEQNLDFNIENYDLEELLNLFHLNYSFNEVDLKKAKKLVFKLHPDKSGLDKRYFLFFCKAFRVINTIYNHRFKTFNPNTEYVVEVDTNNKQLIDSLLKKNNLEFNKWFNEVFDQINIIDEERKGGYGDWFKSDSDIDTSTTTKSMMHQKINEKKQEISALAKREEIRDFNENSNIYKTLDGAAPELYSSDIFSKLKYDDLKKAHTETVVPVSDKDYQKQKQFLSVEALRQYRNNQNIRPCSYTVSEQYFKSENKDQDILNTSMGFRLAKQDEEMKTANNAWWKNLRLLQ